MRVIRPILIALALAGAQPALADEPSPAGHYVLSGVMETGSELLLEQDGRFHWYLVYGALDVFADGKWKIEKDKVVLIAERGPDLPDPGFDRMVLKREGKNLLPEGKPGVYEHVDPPPSRQAD